MKKTDPRVVRAFVDALGERTARLVLDDRTQVQWPLEALPEGTTEGQWIELQVRRIEEPAAARSAVALRKKLAVGDEGEDLILPPRKR